MWSTFRPWFVKHQGRIFGTSSVMLGWYALTYPTGSIWMPKLYYKYSSLTVTDIATSTKAMINEVLMDINTQRSEPLDARKLLFVQGHTPFPEFMHRGSIDKGGAFIVLTMGFEKSQLSRLLPKNVAKMLLLPEEVQRFAIARQIMYAEDNFETVKCYLGLCCIVLYSVLACLLISKLSTPQASRYITKTLGYKNIADPNYSLQHFFPVVLARAFVLGVPLLNMYWGSLYSYSRYLEKEADKKVAALGPSYIAGGVRFYKHCLKTGKHGTNNPIQYKKFKENGDVWCGRLYEKTLPYSTRLKYFKRMLEKENQKTQGENTLPAANPQ